MKRTYGKIRPLNLWDAVAVLAMTAALWFILSGLTWALCELYHLLSERNLH